MKYEERVNLLLMIQKYSLKTVCLLEIQAGKRKRKNNLSTQSKIGVLAKLVTTSLRTYVALN